MRASHLKRQYYAMCSCASFQRTVFPCAFSWEPILYHPVSKVCVCETHLKDSSVFPVFLVGNHICTSRHLKCVCVCVCVWDTLKRQCYPKCSYAFQRTVYARWQCVVFSREQFYAHWQCAIFSREQFIFPAPCKGINLYCWYSH